METILAAVIAAAASVAVTLITVSIQNSKSMAIIFEKLDNLTTEVEKHNRVVERVFHLEEQVKTLFAHDTENRAAMQELAKRSAHADERAEDAHNRLDRAKVDSR